MKINNINILTIVAAIVIVIMTFKFGRVIALLSYYASTIAVGAYLLILDKRCVDAEILNSKTAAGIHAGIVLLNKSMDRMIEKKVQIEGII